MAANPTEEKKTEPPAPEQKTGSGGLKAWLPLLLTLLLMPALAYAMTTFVLIPKLQKGLGTQPADGGPDAAESGGHGSGAEGSHGSAKDKPKHKVQLSKIVVNVNGSVGTRLLLASLTLAGSDGAFKNTIENNTDQLRDQASAILGSKTIADLERPEARNVLRAELLSQFNAALGHPIVQEIYITELAIQ